VKSTGCGTLKEQSVSILGQYHGNRPEVVLCTIFSMATILWHLMKKEMDIKNVFLFKM
jgi:hypothetical protein